MFDDTENVLLQLHCHNVQCMCVRLCVLISRRQVSDSVAVHHTSKTAVVQINGARYPVHTLTRRQSNLAKLTSNASMLLYFRIRKNSPYTLTFLSIGDRSPI